MDVPPPLAERRQWMCWREEYGTKVPYQPSGIRAKSNDRSTWSSFEDVTAAGSRIAYVFAEDDPYCGIDLDDCYDGTNFLPWAQEILSMFRGVAYAEISPSGTGIKLITRAKKPSGSRCDNKEGVECYDHKRYWTITGKCFGEGYDQIGDGQQQLDAFLEKYLPGKRGETRSTAPSSNGSTFELLARGESYVDSCKQAGEGSRNNAAFSIAGHLFSLVGNLGERLSETDVYNLLRRWNYNNVDPLPEHELRQVTKSAKNNGTPPADKPPQERPPEDSGVDLSGILDQVLTSAPSDVPFSPGDFPRECIPSNGIIGQVIAYNLATAIYPQPELAFAGALALMSVITGRKVETEYKTRTNIYVLGIGESGTGKEHARKVNKELLYASECESMVGPERLPSSAGLVSYLVDRLAVLYQIDEIGHLLATMKNPGKSPHLYNIATVLMQLYSSSDSVWIGDSYADSKKTPTIVQPHAVLYGTSTPHKFWGNLTADGVQDGLLGRMLAFECRGYVDRNKPARMDPPTSLVDAIRAWRAFVPGGIDMSNPIPVVAEHTPEAYERYEAHLDGIHDKRKNEPADRCAVWSRSGEKTAKLALIFACSRQEPGSVVVELEDVDRAIQVSNWLTRRMLRQAYDYVSENQTEDAKKRVLRILNTEMDRNTFSRRTQFLKSKERNEILSDLIEQGLVGLRQVETNGRPKTYLKRMA